MTAQEFYEKEHGSHQFLCRADIITFAEKYAAHLKTQKPDDDSHLRKNNYETKREKNFSVHFNRK